MTNVVTVATLSAGLGSGLKAVEVAVPVSTVPAGAVTWTTTTMTSNANGFIDPTVQVTAPPLTEHSLAEQPFVNEHNPALTKVVPVGIASVMLTPWAVEGPKFITGIRYVRLEPVTTFELATLAMSTSAGG